MSRFSLFSLLLVSCVSASVVSAAMLSLAGESLDFTRPEEIAAKATWGSEGDHPLDFTADGIGDESIPDRAFRNAWVKTRPIPLGGNGHPFSDTNLTVDIAGHTDERGYSCVGRVFARHSPDLKNWSSWQPLRRRSAEEWADLVARSFHAFNPKPPGAGPTPEDFATRNTFVGDLGIPRTLQNRYRDYAARFQAQGLPHPRGHEDLVRWILSENPDYFAQDIPFVGYLEVLIEFNASSGKQRLRHVGISVMSAIDDMFFIRAAPANDDTPQSPKRWSFTAEP